MSALQTYAPLSLNFQPKKKKEVEISYFYVSKRVSILTVIIILQLLSWIYVYQELITTFKLHDFRATNVNQLADQKHQVYRLTEQTLKFIFEV